MLTARQMRFVDAVMAGASATQAAIQAGYSPASAGTAGSNLSRNIEVQAELATRRMAVAAKADLKAEDVHRSIRRGLDFDPALCFSDTGAVLNVPDMPECVRRCLTKFKVLRVPGSTDGSETVEVAWTPEVEHRRDAARILGLNRDKLELDVRPHADLVAEAARRAKGAKR